MSIRAIIVDDEPAARSVLSNLLADHCPQVEIIGEAANVSEAVKLINKQKPELVFLDVEMPDENGFALFDYFDKPQFETVFCTAYSHYAIQAFEVSAVDYLLKPLSVSKLLAAVEKVIKIQGQSQIEQRIESMRENLQSKRLQKIAVPLADAMVFVKIDDVLYFEADGSYTHVVTNHAKMLVSKKIKHFEDILTHDSRFFRTHRSFMVNVENVTKYSKKDGASLFFGNGAEVPVAREKIKEFDEFILGQKL